ncbi:MAG: hypothetical protein ACP5PX_03540 [Candidatus Hadarchaeum sp.]|uniref:hypothetical protein n=1 Tax=Candidatus Hadarchaeum sp. TaxID=2883567 RepID=UPI003D1095C6
MPAPRARPVRASPPRDFTLPLEDWDVMGLDRGPSLAECGGWFAVGLDSGGELF